MFPSFQSFEEYQKTVEFCIPPCNFSFHSLHFQNQMMITNHSTKHPVNPIPQVGPIADTELEYPIGTDRDNSMSFDPCNAGVRAGAFPKKRQCRFHGAGNDVENVMSETLGGGNVGLGIVPNHPFHLLDGIGAGVCREGGGSFQQVQESENYAENPTPAEKKRRRMIKNRESAARSRARKQAYTTQLEIEVEQLKNENALLRKRKGCFHHSTNWQPGPFQRHSNHCKFYANIPMKNEMIEEVHR